MKALLVTPENNVEVIEGDLRYEQISEIIGGLIQPVYFGDKNFFAYINEEGKIIGLPINEMATDYWYESGERILLGDCLVGNALFFGEIDDNGDNTSVPEDLINEFMKLKEVYNDLHDQ